MGGCVPSIFISFRKIDNRWLRDRAYQALAEAFGPAEIFKSGESIPAGADFGAILRRQAAECRLMLVLIGTAWSDARDAGGGRLLDRRDDWVRVEIATALAAGNRVVPVLLGDAAMLPAPVALPDDIAELAQLQFLRIPETHVDEGLRRFVGVVSSLLPDLAAAVPASSGSAPQPQQPLPAGTVTQRTRNGNAVSVQGTTKNSKIAGGDIKETNVRTGGIVASITAFVTSKVGLACASVVVFATATTVMVTNSGGLSGGSSGGGGTSIAGAAASALISPPPNVGDMIMAGSATGKDPLAVTLVHANGASPTTIPIPGVIDEMYSVPAGVKGAGTVYVISGTPGPAEVSIVTPSGAVTKVPLSTGVGDAAVAPLGVPGAGTLYAALSEGALLAVTPDGNTRRYAVGGRPVSAAVAPAGTPQAGTVYVTGWSNAPAQSGGFVTIVSPNGSIRDIPTKGVCWQVVVAPANTPNAGTVYALTQGSNPGQNAMVILRPDGSTTTVPLPIAPIHAVIAPAGTPDAGTVFMSDNYPIADADPGSPVFSYSPAGVGTQGPPGKILEVAPAGRPDGGGVFVEQKTQAGAALVMENPNGSTHVLVPHTDHGGDWWSAFVAPVGTPNAGTVFIKGDKTQDNRELIHVLPPSGEPSMVSLWEHGFVAAVGPAGTVDAGCLYISGGPTGGSLSILKVGAAKPEGIPGLPTSLSSPFLIVPASGSGTAWQVSDE